MKPNTAVPPSLLVVAWTVIGAACLVQAMPRPLHAWEEGLRALTAQTHAGRKLHGLLYLAQNEQPLFSVALRSPQGTHSHSVFAVASISKQFTAAVVLRLVDQGKLSLDDTLQARLPYTPWHWGPPITVRQLLNHSSGLSTREQDLAFAPGTAFLYSPTLGFDLLSEIAAQVSGKPYSQLLRELFDAAVLENTAIAQSRQLGQLRKRHAGLVRGRHEVAGRLQTASQLDEGVVLPDGRWQHAGGGILASAVDLARWNAALHHGRLLSRQGHTAMVDALVQRPKHRYGKLGYGLGIQVLKQDGITELSHSGYITGYVSTLLYYPDYRLSVVILENVSWDLKSGARIFGVHDTIRQYVRNQVLPALAELTQLAGGTSSAIAFE